MVKYPFEVYKTISDGHLVWIAKSLKIQDCIGKGFFLSESLADLAKNEALRMPPEVTAPYSIG